MATWIAHLRIAENLLKRGFAFSIEAFLTGNVAPDSGVPNADRTDFIPSKAIGHWKDSNNNIQAEKFYAQHIAPRVEQRLVDAETVFLLGYYCHLLADIEWAHTIWRPKKQTPLYADGLAADPNFVWEIKRDWYGLDFLYLREHPDCLFFTHFIKLETVPDYLDYFPLGGFTDQLKHIQQYYLNGAAYSLERPYIYLNRDELDSYVAQTTEILAQHLSNKIGMLI